LQEDDVYNGCVYPSGSTVIINAWGILHDPHVYPEPMIFMPERYLTADGSLDYSSNDPGKIAFGIGRRICAGMHFAKNSLWIFIAQILATVEISHEIDEQGRKVEAHLIATPGAISAQLFRDLRKRRSSLLKTAHSERE